ncbi:PREDICTED: uncharacterized protein LOC106101414 isoform X2 [Papilio polytes]|uniref:uncharacterized protein LOC106101414 isoform X2 n=1 Tax=Papilio polytes TaxID=76194 RepID=UPI000675EB3F|nr:PREDICTED: uncharacterized protein LOC106101414 isoform X2 [Papilio polytes]
MWRCACALALLCAALARTDTYKRAESTAPFVLGSRYGRSSPRMIAPRNDRFFMGSRYGKRSEIARTLTPHDMTWRDASQDVTSKDGTWQDVTWRKLAHLCELQVFAPLCSRQPSKLLYNRIDQEPVEKMDYKD